MIIFSLFVTSLQHKVYASLSYTTILNRASVLYSKPDKKIK